MVAKKEKHLKNENMAWRPSKNTKDWMHSILAGIVIIFLIFSKSGYWWAYWIALVGAVLIFLSAIASCCKK